MSWGWGISCCCNAQYYYYTSQGVVYGPPVCVESFPTSCSNKGLGGSPSWTNPNNVTATGGGTSTIPNPTATPGVVPDTLVPLGFAFSIPSNALIISMQALIYAERFGSPTITETGFTPKITFAGTDYFPGNNPAATWPFGSFPATGSLIMTTGLPSVADINGGANGEWAFNAVGGSGSGGLSMDALSIKICYKVPI